MLVKHLALSNDVKWLKICCIFVFVLKVFYCLALLQTWTKLLGTFCQIILMKARFTRHNN